ncbi:MAG: hypothetical protein PVF76_11420 [Syntrophobacterales bacterium]
MKKIMIPILCILMVVGFSLPVMGAWTGGIVTLGSGSDGTGDISSYGLSSNVSLEYDVDVSHQAFSINSTHRSGSRVYCTTNNTTLIYYQDKPVGSTTGATVANGATVFTNWTSL